jgi:hypothetical protein
MAKKIASRTALLRDKPHFGSWALFIYFVLLDPTNTQKACQRSMLFFTLFFYLRRCLYNCHNDIDAGTAMLRAPCGQLHSTKNTYPVRTEIAAEGGVHLEPAARSWSHSANNPRTRARGIVCQRLQSFSNRARCPTALDSLVRIGTKFFWVAQKCQSSDLKQ